jgi:D-glycerate 3-kinase
MSTALRQLIEAEGLPSDYLEVAERYWRPLSEDIAERAMDNPGGKPLIVGINGAQGSGKSTLCKFLEVLLVEHNQRGITVALDDLYLTRAERLEAAKDHHPLFATRGVPGTHDVALGETILDALQAGRPVTLPRFDKAIDDRVAVSPSEGWGLGPQPSRSRPEVPAFAGTHDVARPVEVILLEGWCVGAVPQPAADLREPVNALERDEDPDGVWRREVNRRLATDYAGLFDRLDMLIMLKVEDFDAVRANRRLQERKLAASNPGGAAIMDDAALDRFLMHYERLTRWMLAEMPARADVVIEIGPDHRPL